jgi:hypothetical protein
MKTKREHNAYCESKGVSPKICEATNQHMDAPAKEGGGCAHREKYHSSVDCVRWALSGNPKEAIERYHACQIHREADRKTDRCGSKSLIE